MIFVRNSKYLIHKERNTLWNWVKSVQIRIFSALYSQAFRVSFCIILKSCILHSPYSVRMQENTDLKNSVFGHFLCSDNFKMFCNLKNCCIICCISKINIADVWSVSQTMTLLPTAFVFLKKETKIFFWLWRDSVDL